MKGLWIYLPAVYLMGGMCFAQTGTPAAAGPLAACPKSPNCVSSQAGDPEHTIAPLTYTGNRADAVVRLKKALSGMKRTTIVTGKEDYLHAEAKSLLFRFVDDVEFYFPADEKMIHVRSASRVGHSDMGVNRKRVEEIRRRFDKH